MQRSNLLKLLWEHPNNQQKESKIDKQRENHKVEKYLDACFYIKHVYKTIKKIHLSYTNNNYSRAAEK